MGGAFKVHSGMTKWLQEQGFRYKKPKAVPAKAFFDSLKQAYPQASTIHVILDQSGYHRSQELKEGADLRNIKLHYLPPYSPNLNPIEQLWKIMNEQVRNNVFFKSAQDFREAIAHFFKDKIPKIKSILASRINDNFQTLCTVSSG